MYPKVEVRSRTDAGSGPGGTLGQAIWIMAQGVWCHCPNLAQPDRAIEILRILNS